MDDTVFQKGKYQGKTFKDVRINHTDYFMYLINQPSGNVVAYFDFIKYCMDYLRTDNQ